MRVAFMDGHLFEYRLPFLKALRKHVDVLHVFVPGVGFDLPVSELQASGLDVKWIRSIRLSSAPARAFRLERSSPSRSSSERPVRATEVQPRCGC